jgi:broad-specificity NMP kinase
MALAKMMDLEFLSINDFALSHNFGVRKNQEFEVNLRKVGASLNTSNKVVCGHLLPYLLPHPKLDLVVILRCSPSVLKRRYHVRKYKESKMAENLEAELIGVVPAKTLTVYGLEKLAEFDTTRTRNPKTTARRILQTITGKRPKQFGKIDWISSQRTPGGLAKALSA